MYTMGYKTKAHFYAVINRAGIEGPDALNFTRLSTGAAMLHGGGRVVIIYGDTIVLNHKAGHWTIIDAGGWHTVTTKKWINYGLEYINAGAKVYQKAGAWYINREGVTIDYKDGIEIPA